MIYGKEDFGNDLVMLGFVAEYIFHPTRKWRMDWAHPELKISIEYHGGIGSSTSYAAGQRAHTAKENMIRDHEKSNEAQILGWLYLTVNAASVRSGDAWTHVMRAVDLRLEQGYGQ